MVFSACSIFTQPLYPVVYCVHVRLVVVVVVVVVVFYSVLHRE